MPISETNYLIIVSLATLFMFFIFYMIVKSFVEDFLRNSHSKRFSIKLRKSLNSSLKIESSAWSIHQLALYWKQPENAVIGELRNFLNEKIEKKASDYDIDLIKEMMERQEHLFTISSVPMLLQPYVSDLIKDGRYGGDKAKQLVRYIKNTEQDYAKKISEQNNKTNLSLIIGFIGLLSLFWGAYKWIYEFFI